MNKLIQTKKYNKKFNAFAGLEFMKKKHCILDTDC